MSLSRLSCAPTLKENPASRLNDYFRLIKDSTYQSLNPISDELFTRDELTSERDVESSYYLYERSGMLWGQYTEGTWHFGLKVPDRKYHIVVLTVTFFRTYLAQME